MIQIVFNIAILSVLFFWVYWGTRKEFATRREMLDIAKSFGAIANDNIDEYAKDKAAFDEEIKRLNNKIEGMQRTVDPSIEAISIGAHIARENIECGSRIVLDALARDGRIAPESINTNTVEAINLGEDDFAQPTTKQELPDIIVTRNRKAAEQIGDRVLDDLMRGLDENI